MIDPEQVIEIRDPEINVEKIMQEIRERIRQRREQAGRQGLDYDDLIDEKGLGMAGRLPPDLYRELHQFCTTGETIGVSLAMRDRHLPILNSVFYRIEELLHRLVVKYVNMFAGRQIAVNRSSAHLFSKLVRALEERDARIEELENQVAALKSASQAEHPRMGKS